MVSKVLFSSATDEWNTPIQLYEKLDEEFHFTVDAAATEENSLCDSFYVDGLLHKWEGTVWLNPPYSLIGPFIKKAHHESKFGAVVVCLIPSRTDTKYWHNHVMKAAEIRFVRGRLKFGGSKNSAPFPNAIVVFRPGCDIPTILSQERY